MAENIQVDVFWVVTV